MLSLYFVNTLPPPPPHPLIHLVYLGKTITHSMTNWSCRDQHPTCSYILNMSAIHTSHAAGSWSRTTAYMYIVRFVNCTYSYVLDKSAKRSSHTSGSWTGTILSFTYSYILNMSAIHTSHTAGSRRG